MQLLLFLAVAWPLSSALLLQSFSNARTRTASICFASSQIEIYKASDQELLDGGLFLSESMYDQEMSEYQRRELGRLEQQDLKRRYSSVASSYSPAALFLARENGVIIGSVGLQSQIFSQKKERFRNVRGYIDVAELVLNDEIVTLTLSNLAIKPEKRKKGLAKKLLRRCEIEAKMWGFNAIYLLVDSENAKAQKLYYSQGYKKIYEDREATCVAPADLNSLTTKYCINYCLRKDLSGGPVDFLKTLIVNLFPMK